MLKVAIAIPFILTFCAGCATTPEQISNRDDLDVCKSYGVYRTGILVGLAPAYKDEIDRRGLLTDEEKQLVADKSIKLGMSLCAMYASWGSPSYENRTVLKGSVNIQHVYNAGLRYIRKNYVYTRNGKVTAWQGN